MNCVVGRIASVVVCILTIVLADAMTLMAADNELPARLPGLLADVDATVGSGHVNFRRVDLRVQQSWSSPGEFDERIAGATSFRVRWRGLLEIKAEGSYRLHFYGVGKFKLIVDGRQWLAGENQGQGKWFEGPPIDMNFGFHPIELAYESKRPGGQAGFYWQGPGFQLEPITERYLAHATADSPSDVFERGRVLAHGLRCVACHSGSPQRPRLSAPELTRLDGNLNREWLIGQLTAVPKLPTADGQADNQADELADDRIARRMPHFALSRADATDIAAALWNASLPVDRSSSTGKSGEKKPAAKPAADEKNSKATAAAKGKGGEKKRTTPNADEGKLALNTRGCLACHTLQSRGLGVANLEEDASFLPGNRLASLTSELFSGGDLGAIASKRPEDFFSRWLAEPEKINPQHRMPHVSLTDLEREDIGLYLATLRGDLAEIRRAEQLKVEPNSGDPARGKALLAAHGCAACHTLPESLQKSSAVVRSPLGSTSRWDAACLGQPQTVGQRSGQGTPRYALTEGQRHALKVYWTTPAGVGLPMAVQLAELNCLACHARDGGQGIAPRVNQLVAIDRELAPSLSALLPPSLSGIGDKLHDETLRSVVEGREPARRPWLEVRMPKYSISASQRDQLVAHLIDRDRIPEITNDRQPLPDDVVTRAAAGRLVTSEGFGCQSCHKIGSQPSPTVALNARGTDLTMVGQRIRHAWFDRWVRNPVRIVPRMEMPAIQLPVHGVLGTDLARQIDAVWEMLNTEGFQPPSPAPVRIVRGHNLAGSGEAANVLTDVLETPGEKYLRPLIVGLGNRHNLLVDLEKAEYAQWWIGDTARELTRGKSWYWEIGGQPLTSRFPRLARMQIVDAAGQVWQAKAQEQFAIDFDALEHTVQGVRWKGRAYFSHRDAFRVVPIELTCEPLAIGLQGESGIEVGWSAKLPTGFSLQLAFDESMNTLAKARNPEGTSRDIWEMVIDDQSSLQMSSRHGIANRTGPRTLTLGSEDNSVQLGMRWSTRWSVDQVSQATDPVAASPTDKDSPPRPKAAVPIELSVVPGFRGTQLPLPRDEMPTALSWHRGDLIIGSLKGRVCRAIDTDRDGLADVWQPLSDDLPAPYGIASHEEGIDVLAKFGLIRLTEPPASSPAAVPWSQSVVADGWGYTSDYHDWAVGLPRDAQGNYYVALPCQQDDRTPSAARLRGSIQRLIPQSATSENPRRYRLETLCAGQRFPMGLAFNKSGDLFATDNQGNYNPFNEVNHLQFGKRYGFINKLENKPDFNPPLESPAINLPHPWTRSVNGICFLISPKDDSRFGPFEGHMIGCEYNGLSLIRMSTEIVDGVYQGAAYPFSRLPEAGEATFEGPVTCAVSPVDGDLYIGNIHDSGWGGGQNTGSIVRLQPNGQWPLGIAEVRADREGLIVRFTKPIDPTLASKIESFQLRSYRRVSTPAYGGSDQEERQEKIVEARVDGPLEVLLRLDELRADSVYELRVGAIGSNGQRLFPNEAHYSMKRTPRR